MSPLFERRSAPEWLVVCLGNPGPKYEGTRHNAGFLAADAISRKTGAPINRLRFKALTASCVLGGRPVLVMKPQIVISDEMALPVGKIRVKSKGSAGGHNGLKNIIACLGTEEFPRIRIGVGAPPHPDYDTRDWVLSTFKNQDAEDIADAARRAADAAACYIADGAEKSMNSYNGT